jgi:hypothetical protein
MGKGIKGPAGADGLEPVSLSQLIHQHVRAAIEGWRKITAVLSQRTAVAAW